MYFLETNIFWPNPHPTRTHHTKFPVPSPGHSTTVPWRVIFYLFNFYFLKFSHSSSCSNQLTYTLLSGHYLLSSHPLSHPLFAYFHENFFFLNNEINFTWLGAVNAPRDHGEPPWLLLGRNVITIQSTIGHPRKERICILFGSEVSKWQRDIFPLISKCPTWTATSLSPPTYLPSNYLAIQCRIIRRNKKKILVKPHITTQIPVFNNW